VELRPRRRAVALPPEGLEIDRFYPVPGVYSGTVTVEDDLGQVDVVQTSVTVLQPSVPALAPGGIAWLAALLIGTGLGGLLRQRRART
jgi:hypothetical protein